MNINDLAGLDALCHACGVATSYYDIEGTLHQPDTEVKRSLLAALEYPVNNDADIQSHLATIRSREWQHLVEPLLVHRQRGSPVPVSLVLTEEQWSNPVNWALHEENGQSQNGSWQVSPDNANAEHWLNEIQLKRFVVELPLVHNYGYHQLSIQAAGNVEASCTFIVAPDSCFEPRALENQQKVWGVSLQLYSLRSQRNWGIGDFTDLQAAIEILAAFGADIIGVNPLHTLFSHQPEKASPYSTSSRDYLNPVYLDIEASEDYSDSRQAQEMVRSQDFQANLQALRAEEIINYEGVWAAKLNVLQLLFQNFKCEHLQTSSSRVKEFLQYQSDAGEDFFKFGVFEALQSHFHKTDSRCTTWQQWPDSFQHSDSSQVRQWAEENKDAIEFHQYLQWISDKQLARVEEYCRDHGMTIGLYRDLAVGNEKSAAQCWAAPELYAPGMGVGAPPDGFNSKGQNWELPPLKPATICTQNYLQFAKTLRANMRYAGALRIDHILGLMRLYWIPQGLTPQDGSYVSYPFHQLLGILALESHRNNCMVIGEDLGTVPDEVRYALEPNKILSFRILCFEKDWQQGTFKAPHEYPRYALCTSGSHDLPTLAAYWQDLDMELRAKLDLFPSSDSKDQQLLLRAQDRYQIVAALQRESLSCNEALEDAGAATALNDELAISIQRFLARSNAEVMMVQLEDLLSQKQQVNVPGTIDEHPNWRGKLSIDLDDWLTNSKLEVMARAINSERRS